MSDPLSALPSVRARVIAFVSIMALGGLGGAIGYWFGQLQTEGDALAVPGLLMLAGTLVFALGSAAVAVISLRALAEWNGDDGPSPLAR